MSADTTPPALLRFAVVQGGARPFLTCYDDRTGERVELSVATFDNWVAKTAGLLRDGLDVMAGDRVALLLPAHWQSLVLACACWEVGACATLADAADGQLAVVGPATLDAASRAPERLALSLRPLGAPFTEPLPAGTLDYAVEVPSFPDRFAADEPPDPVAPALDDGSIVTTSGGLVGRARERAAQLEAGSGARLLVATDDLPTALLDALLVPLVVGGSAVLVRNEIRERRADRLASERARPAEP
ncbi:MAG TPA: TIGR03089 family protein [Jiangellaceae bacterium]|nr:TIGR03089 family protein [Jiangellaceae bacterium]